MDLPAVDRAIEACRAHLDATGTSNTEIEAYLVRYLLVLTCGEYERTVEELVVARAHKSGDSELASFVASAVDQLFRSCRTGEIAGLLGRFGKDVRGRFQEKVGGSREETAFNDIVTNRHTWAHGGTVQMTFRELREAHLRGKKVLDACAAALGV